MAAADGSAVWTSDTIFQGAILNSTNYYRSQHQVDTLRWNVTLASYAQNYAGNCVWEHSGGPYGENLAENFGTPGLAIDGWAAEEKHYNYRKARFSEQTGHYTQLVWKATTSVGCGAIHCSSNANDGANGWYLVCEYYPPGNVAGEYRENVIRQGAGKNGLLSVGDASRPGGWKGLFVALVLTGSLVAMW